MVAARLWVTVRRAPSRARIASLRAADSRPGRAEPYATSRIPGSIVRINHIQAKKGHTLVTQIE